MFALKNRHDNHGPSLLAETSLASQVLSRGRAPMLMRTVSDSPDSKASMRESNEAHLNLEQCPSMTSECSNNTARHQFMPPVYSPMQDATMASPRENTDKIDLLLSVATGNITSPVSPSSVHPDCFMPNLDETTIPSPPFKLKPKPRAYVTLEAKSSTSFVPVATKPPRQSHEEKWNSMFARLEAFKARTGHCQVPRDFKEDRRLSKWVVNQRCRKSTTSAERIQRLDSIGFAWKIKQSSPKQIWEEKYQRLVEYKKRHGDCIVPSKYQNDPSLGRWVHAQRFNRNLLPRDRREKLDKIGFVWSVNHDTWDVMFQRLEEFKDRTGHCHVPMNFVEFPKLRGWVVQQRARRGLLTKSRRDRLDALGFNWNSC